jgi:hypothetical protein
VSRTIDSIIDDEEFSSDVVTKIAILSNKPKGSSRQTRSQNFTSFLASLRTTFMIWHVKSYNMGFWKWDTASLTDRPTGNTDLDLVSRMALEWNLIHQSQLGATHAM